MARTSDVLIYLFFFKFKRVETQMQMQHLMPEEITEKLRKIDRKQYVMFGCIFLLDLVHIGLLFIDNYHYFKENKNPWIAAANITQIFLRCSVFLYFIYLTQLFTRMSLRYFENLGLLKGGAIRWKILTVTAVVATLILGINLIRIYIVLAPYIIYKFYLECDPLTRGLSLWLINI